MKYTVTWSPEAEDALADVWVRAGDRDAVTASAERIERALAADPLTTGESREAGRRIIVDKPLVAFYEVDAAARRVFVLTAHRPKGR